jgi:RimK family alpha-L-glutamate ligase
MDVWIFSRNSEVDYENKRLIETFTKKNITSKVVEPSGFDIIVNKNIKNSILYNGQLVELPKVVLVRTGAETNNFMLAVLRQLDKAGIICINEADAVETASDKLKTSQILSQHNISIPNTMMVKHPVDSIIVKDRIGFPCVVKVITGTQGVGVYLCEKRRDFNKLMEFIHNVGISKTLLLQEYMGSNPGEDLRVLVIGGKVIGAMKRIGPKGDFRANISNGGTGKKFKITPEIDFIARETARILNLHIAGIDLLFDNDGFVVCEANSAPGFKGFEKYCGIDIAELIVEYIDYKLFNKDEV